MSENFVGVLESWKGSKVIVVNPESYTSTALREGLGFESYGATLTDVAQDHVVLTYTAQRKGKSVEVTQWIPLVMVKRVTLMGEEKLIHL